MVLILSDEDDFSTNIVIDWLNYYNIDFLRVNRTSEIRINWIKIDDNGFDYLLTVNNNETIKYSEVKFYWYRRGFIRLDKPTIESNNFIVSDAINKHLNSEIESLTDFLYLSLQMKKRIGKVTENKINKLNNLILASSIGLNIPETLITTSKEYFNSLLVCNKTITKAIYNGFHMKLSESKYGGYTSLIEQPSSNSFAPSKFQECVDKLFELRIVFIYNSFYSSAIFSQSDKQTSIDFRLYNYQKPNRVVPFLLPGEVEKKLKKFITSVGLTSGSIDMIYSKSEKFVFLEVNPVGQYVQVSKPCNYYIDKAFTKAFIEKLVD